MSKGFEELTRAAEQLPRKQRLTLARVLLELDESRDESAHESEWDAEIRARIEAIDAGRAEGLPYEEVLSRLDKRTAS